MNTKQQEKIQKTNDFFDRKLEAMQERKRVEINKIEEYYGKQLRKLAQELNNECLVIMGEKN
jgi:hypothetical protein